jgi:hypothetical protein
LNIFGRAVLLFFLALIFLFLGGIIYFWLLPCLFFGGCEIFILN